MSIFLFHYNFWKNVYCYRAFAKLPADVVNHLVDNPPILRQVLLNHVVGGTWYSAGLEDGMALDTLQMDKLAIDINDGNTVCLFYI